MFLFRLTINLHQTMFVIVFDTIKNVIFIMKFKGCLISRQFFYLKITFAQNVDVIC